MNSSSPNSPYRVPPFAVESSPIKLHWYYWHPFSPYWSRYNCYSYTSVADAVLALDGEASHLSTCHNKLILDRNGVLTEIMDVPCERMDIWLKIKDNEEKGFYKK